MNKKLKTFGILILLIGLVGSVVAGLTLANNDKTITFTKDEKAKLTSRGITNPIITDSDIKVNGVKNRVKRNLYQEDAINDFTIINTYFMNCTEYNEAKECLNEERIDYTNEQIENKLDAWQESRLKGLAEPEDVIEVIPTKEGIVSFK